MFFGKSKAVEAATKVAAHLQKRQPTLGWQAELTDPSPRVYLQDRIVATFENGPDGVFARTHEPGQPGEDEPPVPLRAIYEVTSFGWHLEGKAQLLGKLTVYGLRKNAVYEVIRDFNDCHGQPFTQGTRLTYVDRNFVPYHGGHTVRFVEAILYLQEEEDTYLRFENYLAVASRQ